VKKNQATHAQRKSRYRWCRRTPPPFCAATGAPPPPPQEPCYLPPLLSLTSPPPSSLSLRTLLLPPLSLSPSPCSPLPSLFLMAWARWPVAQSGGMEAAASDSGEQAHGYASPSFLSLPFLDPPQSSHVLIDEIFFFSLNRKGILGSWIRSLPQSKVQIRHSYLLSKWIGLRFIGFTSPPPPPNFAISMT
jgi:hypothetical protein